MARSGPPRAHFLRFQPKSIVFPAPVPNFLARSGPNWRDCPLFWRDWLSKRRDSGQNWRDRPCPASSCPAPPRPSNASVPSRSRQIKSRSRQKRDELRQKRCQSRHFGLDRAKKGAATGAKWPLKGIQARFMPQSRQLAQHPYTTQLRSAAVQHRGNARIQLRARSFGRRIVGPRSGPRCSAGGVGDSHRNEP